MTLNSIRLRVSLASGLVLLVLLFSVYVGGYIVVQMIGDDVQVPDSFTALARVALGWLTCFIAVVGIVFVIPIFWLQSRLFLNPLDTLTQQIREIGSHLLDEACPAIDWPHDDEFGVLAQSVNEMIGVLALKTRQNEQSKQSQRALIAGMPDGLCVFDVKGRLVSLLKQPDYTNPIPGLVVGESLSPPIFPESDCDAFGRAMREALCSDRTQMVMLCCREADGSYRHFEVRVSRMDDEQGVVVWRDVTKSGVNARCANRSRHILRKYRRWRASVPWRPGLPTISTTFSRLSKTRWNWWIQSDDEESEAARTIRQAADKGATLTRELMTYAGHTTAEFECQDVNAMIRELKSLMSGVVAQNVILDFKLAPDLPPVAADPHQFWKVIINLLRNASEAFKGASGHITVSTSLLTLTRQISVDFFSTRPLPFERGLLIQIEDTGPGIPPDVLDRIFEPFVSTKAVGRGLGLATVFGIVDVHNGGIAIQTELGKGTCFRIWLPVFKQPQPVSDAGAGDTQSGATDGALTVTDPHAKSNGNTARPLVLLVEDEPAILRTTGMVLRSLGIEALMAASQREAQTLFSQHADDIRLLLLDAQADSLDNVRLLSILRLSRPDLPTIILSGHAEERVRTTFASARYDAFLGKPYTRDELKAVLQNFIDLS